MNIELKIKSLGYQSNPLMELENLNLNLKSGDILLIKGDTGAGKTTILKVFCGLIPFVQKSDFEGYVKINGRPADFNLLRKASSFCSQEPENQFLMSNVENEILFNLNSTEREKATELLSFFNLADLKNKSVKDLSAGQRKIISLIPVLASDKKIKILDEPSSNLDIENKNKLKGLIRKFEKDNIFIISSHDILFDDIANKYVNLGGKPEKKEVVFNLKINRNEKVLSLKDVGVNSPDNFFSLQHISFEIFSGDIFGIFGPNGSGKTTLINLISGRAKKSSGEFNLRKALKISLVMQEPEKQLFSNTVLGEVMLSGKLNESEALKLLEKAGLKYLAAEHPFFLSRGQKQILLIIATLNSNPDIIIFDELMTGIDAKNGMKILELIKEYYEKNHPTIILTDQDDYPYKNFISDKFFLEKNRLDRYSEGLVHYVYKKGDLIYKKVKENFVDFKGEDHFILEKKVLELLKKKGITSANVRGIEKVGGDFYLVEDFITGYQKGKGELNPHEIDEILKFVDNVHKIKLKGYGEVSGNLCGKYKTWRDFISRSLRKNTSYLVSKEVISQELADSAEAIVLNNLSLLEYRFRGSVVLTDLNPMNFFFNNNQRLTGAIDIDHPISGDPLYEYGCLRWYQDDIFTYLANARDFSFEDLKKILIYEALCGISVISWMHMNNLDIEGDTARLKNKLDSIERSLISLSDLSLLIVKPEAIPKIDSIKKELNKMGYETIKEVKKGNFLSLVQKLYEKDYSKKDILSFREAYAKSGLGESYLALILRRKSGNTIENLKVAVGDYKEYQKKRDSSLRCRFGLPSSHNFKSGKFTMYFNGFHKIDSIEDFIYHLNLLKIGLI